MTARDRPVVVVMPLYEGAAFVAEQVRSIAEQSSPVDVLHLVDDGSTDGTLELAVRTAAAAFEASATVIVPHERTRNEGLVAALTRGLGAAVRGGGPSIVVLSDQDDVWLPTKVERVRTAFRDGDVALWASDAEVFGEPSLGAPTLWAVANIDPGWMCTAPAAHLLGRLLGAMTFTGATMAVRSDVVERSLPFPGFVRSSGGLMLHDAWLALLASCSGALALEPTPQIRYRRHPGQVTASGTSIWLGPATPDVRHQRIAAQHEILSEVARRLVPAAGPRIPAATVETLLRFTAARLAQRQASLPTAGWVRALARGDYRRHAAGWRTAASDLLHL